ncbi:hypothetical protein FOZ63_021819 [Perkinsus olseni]|uniref:C3H1-type domain-containing protein n=1 Tax=Perkinsus olseni TaxID=32597 RepID=A0A7J6SLC5_PEROL|nr:hypothetical protein FOZ63_021819 [Perkinsus olseni]
MVENPSASDIKALAEAFGLPIDTEPHLLAEIPDQVVQDVTQDKDLLTTITLRARLSALKDMVKADRIISSTTSQQEVASSHASTYQAPSTLPAIAKIPIPDNKKYIGLDDERSISYFTEQLLAESLQQELEPKASWRYILDAFEYTPRANISAAVRLLCQDGEWMHDYEVMIKYLLEHVKQYYKRSDGHDLLDRRMAAIHQQPQETVFSVLQRLQSIASQASTCGLMYTNAQLRSYFINALHDKLRAVAKTTYPHIQDPITMAQHLDMFLNEQDNPSQYLSPTLNRQQQRDSAQTTTTPTRTSQSKRVVVSPDTYKKIISRGICFRYYQNGTCPFGDSCYYKHIKREDDLQQNATPDTTSKSPADKAKGTSQRCVKSLH